MKKLLIIASLGALTFTAGTAMADHNWRKRKFIPWQENNAEFYGDEEDFDAMEEDDESDVIFINRRKHQMEEAEREVDAKLWWLEDNARKKLESHKKPTIKKVASKPVLKKPVAKPKTVAATKPSQAKLQTASLTKPTIITKPKPIVAKPKPVSAKTIGCTAGAAVITGYGFGEVKPKACTGNTYAYTAARAGKIYEIQLTAASGEIVDVKKLN